MREKPFAGLEPEVVSASGGESARWNSFLSLVMRYIRSQRPTGVPQDYGWFIEHTRYWGKPYELPLAWFVTNGCSWSAAGSCTMCNFGIGEGVDRERILWQVDRILERVAGLPVAYITPLGSMFDDTEVPRDVRMAIFQRVARNGCRIFGTESRPETITDEKMAEFRHAFGGKMVLQIGLGLESADPYVRRNCINKGLRESDYLEAIGIMHKYNIQPMVHVLLKPPFLTEAEAVQDALRTVDYAFEHGAARVIFFMTNLKPHTLTSWLQERGLYRVPYVWSGIHALQNMKPHHRKLFTLSGIYSGMPVNQTAHNCPHCTEVVIEGLQHYSGWLDQQILDELSRYRCSCRTDWETAMQEDREPLPKRLARQYEYIARQMFGDTWWEQSRDWVLAELAD